MGWKKIKEVCDPACIVHVDAEGIWLGTEQKLAAACISPKTGVIYADIAEPGFLKAVCPGLLAMTASQIRMLIQIRDEFLRSIPVYSYDFETGEIINDFCETVGYPNVTHGGQLMHEGDYSTDRQHALDLAREDAEFFVRMNEERVARLRADLEKFDQAGKHRFGWAKDYLQDKMEMGGVKQQTLKASLKHCQWQLDVGREHYEIICADACPERFDYRLAVGQTHGTLEEIKATGERPHVSANH